ncbi:MAG TPA: MOSC domain-containing protein [Planctomycetaceae bacterium]|nr:MOSC domain-containing protein [Planctomycetaceae bacterium]
MQAVKQARLEAGRGILGDHYRRKRHTNREVTLIQAEDLAKIATRLPVPADKPIPPELLRRNLVVSGVVLSELQGRRLRIGAVILEGTGPCSPCARMDEALGPGGRKAMSGRGGITAAIVQGGEIRVGDAVAVLPGGRDFGLGPPGTS